MAFKMSGPSLYKGTPLKQETAETFEKNANNKAKNLRKETYAADDRGDALSANISEAGIRKTFDSQLVGCHYTTSQKSQNNNGSHPVGCLGYHFIAFGSNPSY